MNALLAAVLVVSPLWPLVHAITLPNVKSLRISQLPSSPALLDVKGKGDLQRQITEAQNDWKVIPDIWASLESIIPHQIMLVDNIHNGNTNLTYAEANRYVLSGATSMQSLGMAPGDCTAIFAENSIRWFLFEQAVMKAGGCSAVRGASAPVDELVHIFQNSESTGLAVESPDLLFKLFGSNGVGFGAKGCIPKYVIVLYPGRSDTGSGLSQAVAETSGVMPPIYTFLEWQSLGASAEFSPVMRNESSTATLVYTSGTTSMPKGVILRHSNIMHQVKMNTFSLSKDSNSIDPSIGETFVSILPCWHIFERTAEYYVLSKGVQLVYSNLKNFKNDLITWRPHLLIAVPRVLEMLQKGINQQILRQSRAKQRLIAVATALSTMYKKAVRSARNLNLGSAKPNAMVRLLNTFIAVLLWPFYKIVDRVVWKKIRNGLGGRIKLLVSGGASLPMSTEIFFDTIGMRILAGYGLTETSPVLSSRVAEQNVLGSVGHPLTGTECRIVDPETKEPVAKGESGVLLVRSPSVMAGYMRSESATSEAIDADGFFSTGDLVKFDRATDMLVVTGRSKDTIVLANGENVVPGPIEESIVSTCSLIDQVMLVGQDQRFIGAICVLNIPALLKAGLVAAGEAAVVQDILGPSAATSGPRGDVTSLRR
jgi:long-chain acyl-CoA synthetase